MATAPLPLRTYTKIKRRSIGGDTQTDLTSSPQKFNVPKVSASPIGLPVMSPASTPSPSSCSPVSSSLSPSLATSPFVHSAVTTEPSTPNDTANNSPNELCPSVSVSQPQIRPAHSPPSLRHPLNRKRRACQKLAEPLSEHPMKKRRVSPRKGCLEFNQKGLGGKTCPKCLLFYCPGNSIDESLHRDVHRKYLQIWTFGIKKSENVVHVWANGDRAIKIDAIADRRMQEKAKIIREAIDAKLDCPPHQNEENLITFLYISKDRAVGVVVVRPIHCAFSIQEEVSSQSIEPLGKPLSCSKEPLPAALGISRIWVDEHHRRHHIATKLLDIARFVGLGCLSLSFSLVLFPLTFFFHLAGSMRFLGRWSQKRCARSPNRPQQGINWPPHILVHQRISFITSGDGRWKGTQGHLSTSRTAEWDFLRNKITLFLLLFRFFIND